MFLTSCNKIFSVYVLQDSYFTRSKHPLQGCTRRMAERRSELKNEQHREDRFDETRVYNKLGDVYGPLGDLKEAIEYYERSLGIAKEIGDIAEEVQAYRNLGSAYDSLNEFKQAIEYHELHLTLAKKMEDRAEEGISYGNLGNDYERLGQFKKAMEHHQKHLTIAKELGDRDEEGAAYCGLGKASHDLGDFKRAIEYHKRHLAIAKEIGDRGGEGAAYCNLGIAYHRLGDFKQAIEYLSQDLVISKELGDRAGEGTSYCNLGITYHSMGDFKKAIDYHKKHLDIAIEQHDKFGEGAAYCNLGRAYRWIGDIKQAIEYHKRDLCIAKELGNKASEGISYGNLGNDFESLGNFKQAMEYHNRHLCICIEVGDRAREGTSYGDLGRTYHSIGELKKAKECYNKNIKIAKEVGDRAGLGLAYGKLGKVYHDVGDFELALKYMTKGLNIAQEVGEKARVGRAHDNLGKAYQGFGDFKQAIEHHNQGLSIAKEVGDRVGEGRAYGNLGRAYYGVRNFKQATEYHNMHLNIAKELGDRAGEGRAYGGLGRTFQSLGDFDMAIEYHKQYLDLSKQVGDIPREGIACYSLGSTFESMGDLEEAVHYFQLSIKVYDRIRALLEGDIALNVPFCNFYQKVYTGLWRTLLKLQKPEDALSVADQGRAQDLIDLMKLQYEVELLSSGFAEHKETISGVLGNVPAQTQSLFIALESSTINFWVLGEGNEIHFRQTEIKDEDVSAYLQCLKENAEREILSSDQPTGDSPIREKGSHEILKSSRGKNNPLCLLYDTVIGPIADLLNGDELLIIVPSGPLCLIPYAAFVDPKSRYLGESIKIRLVPSLTCLKLITDCPAGRHSKTGALLVGDPCMEKVTNLMGRPIYNQVPSTRKEVEIIGEILKTAPLTGTQATKDEVLKRIGSVCLVHIAACTEIGSSKIALAPNQARTLEIPREDDYVLTTEDLQTVKLRARLVVFSCCHTDRQTVVLEGVVGIVRAFLGAGARSVLLSLWRSDDEATIELMRCFYQHLTEGNSVSVALHQAMKCLRESERFAAVKYWAPFVLIGDDVTINFET